MQVLVLNSVIIVCTVPVPAEHTCPSESHTRKDCSYWTAEELHQVDQPDLKAAVERLVCEPFAQRNPVLALTALQQLPEAQCVLVQCRAVHVAMGDTQQS
jgi:hypothetical protein